MADNTIRDAALTDTDLTDSETNTVTDDGIQHGIDDDPQHDPEKGAVIGGVGGAIAGAAAGSLVGPGGAVLGAVIGGVAGAAASAAAVAAVDRVDNDDNITGVGAAPHYEDEGGPAIADYTTSDPAYSGSTADASSSAAADRDTSVVGLTDAAAESGGAGTALAPEGETSGLAGTDRCSTDAIDNGFVEADEYYEETLIAVPDDAELAVAGHKENPPAAETPEATEPLPGDTDESEEDEFHVPPA